MARLNLLLPTTLFVSLLAAGSAWAENIALVISNGTYAHGSTVRAIDRAHSGLVRTYEARGYRVYGGNNLNRAAMAREMEAFEGQLDDADIAVVQLVGHTAALGDHGWFLPVDINPNSATDFEMGGVSFNLFAQMLGTHDARAVLFIGSSGDDVSGIRGVDGGIGAVNAPPGLLVVSGLYGNLNTAITNEFLKVDARLTDAMNRSGSRLNYSGYISSRLVLAPRNAPVVTPPRVVITPPVVQRTPETIEAALGLTRTQRRRIQENLTVLRFDTRGVDGVFGRGTRSAIAAWQADERLEVTGYITQAQIGRLERRANAERRVLAEADEAYWRSTGASGREDDLNRYLRRYPQGAHATEAQRLLQQAVQRADETYWRETGITGLEDDLNRYLRRYPEGVHATEARRMLQRVSTQGDETYWRETGASGLEDDLIRYLRRYPEGVHANEARRMLQQVSGQTDQDEWERALNRNTIRAFERYLERFPDGLYNRAAKARLLALGGELDRDTSGRDDPGAGQSAAEAAARAAENALGMDNSTRLLIELRLIALGYRPGAPDGIFDSDTRAALSAFQRDRSMPSTGYVNALTITALLRGG